MMHSLTGRALLLCLCLAPFGSTQRLLAEQVIFSELMFHPAGAAPEFIEIENLTATPFDIANWKFSDGINYEFPPFDPGDPQAAFLKPFERILVSPVDEASLRAAYSIPVNTRIFGPYSGSLNNAGERIALDDKNGITRSQLNYSDGRKWPAAADGAGHSLVVIDGDRLNDDYRNWTFSKTRGGTPGSAEILEAEEPYPNPEVNLSTGIPFVNYGDKWSFHDQNQDLGTSWKDVTYNFAHPGWVMENAPGNNGGLYGFENAGLPAPGIRTDLLNSTDVANHLTYYFRKEFTYSGSTGAGVNVTVDMINDDGATFYLNGTPIGGRGVPGGATWQTAANRTVGDATEELAVATAAGADLVVGTNILAAEVHQTNATSSDCVFGARLSISAPSAPSIVINEVPARRRRHRLRRVLQPDRCHHRPRRLLPQRHPREPDQIPDPGRPEHPRVGHRLGRIHRIRPRGRRPHRHLPHRPGWHYGRQCDRHPDASRRPFARAQTRRGRQLVPVHQADPRQRQLQLGSW